MPNGCKIFQMGTKFIIIFYSKALQNILKQEFFGLKIYHLATLLESDPIDQKQNETIHQITTFLVSKVHPKFSNTHNDNVN
jgi:hypothetical protein